jgi:hypothetical protein
VLILCAAYLVAVPAAEALSYPNEPKGFRGIEWGAVVGAMPSDLVPDFAAKAPLSGDAVCYARSGDRLAIGPVPLVSIDYVVTSGKFSGAMLRFAGIPAFQDMKDVLYGRFGFPSRRAPVGQDAYYWEGGRTVMHLVYDAHSGQGALTLFSREALKEISGIALYDGRVPLEADVSGDF